MNFWFIGFFRIFSQYSISGNFGCDSQWKNHFFFSISSFFYIFVADFTYSTQGLPKVYPRSTQDVAKVYPRCSQGLPKVYPRCTQGVAKVKRLTSPWIEPEYCLDGIWIE